MACIFPKAIHILPAAHVVSKRTSHNRIPPSHPVCLYFPCMTSQTTLLPLEFNRGPPPPQKKSKTAPTRPRTQSLSENVHRNRSEEPRGEFPYDRWKNMIRALAKSPARDVPPHPMTPIHHALPLPTGGGRPGPRLPKPNTGFGFRETGKPGNRETGESVETAG